ncbi:MAG TPA: hypothetical protein DHN29_08210 [Cytophagales bacterium]|nr:hypothetical protein [Cytophagales bacterium]|tara:strand:- start:1729 stop:2211 length:483 start_codon:yes stop_codon:yes gene_type:complete
MGRENTPKKAVFIKNSGISVMNKWRNEEFTEETRMIQVYLTFDIGAVGQNPESADISNPQGYTYGKVYSFVAEDHKGNRWSKPASDEEAQAVIDGGELPEFEKDGTWKSTHSVYGSQAYQENGEEAEFAVQELLADPSVTPSEFHRGLSNITVGSDGVPF